MSYNTAVKNHPKSLHLRSLIVFVLLLSLGAILIYFESYKYIETKKQSALQIASAEASVLSQRLNASISLAYTLEVFLREKGFEIDQFFLDNFSAPLFKTHPSVSSLQYAPNGVVTYISPMVGNEAAVGHTLLDDPKRNKEVFDSVEKRILTVAGPFELIQGGVALVARLPIFHGAHGEGEFWGFSTVLIKIDDLMDATTISSLTSNDYKWNLSRIHPDTKQPHIFYGPSSELLTDAVQLEISAPNAVWFLSLQPINGWLSGHHSIIFTMFVVWGIITSVITYLSYQFFKKPYELRQQVAIRTQELKSAKEVLSQSEQRLLQIAENNQMWIWEVNSEGKYTYCSNACQPILGFSANEIIGKKHFYDLFHPEDKENLKKAAFKAFEHRLPFHDFENRNLSRSGEVVWLSTSGVPIISPEDELIGYRGADIDITQKKLITEEHARAAQLAVLGTVAAGVAHEINNPINGVINYAQILKSKANIPEAVLDIAARISKESERIAKITKDLLHYSKDNREEFSLINMKELINSALSLIVPKVKQKGIIVEVKISDVLPEFYGNPQSIQQVIINLVDNAYDALRYKENIEEDKIISIDCLGEEKERSEQICIQVTDNGIGMPKDVVSKAKDAFFTTKPSIEGSGLGLSIVNEIIGRHNGSFSIESSEGEYTKVTICLPMEARHRDHNPD